MLFKEKGDHEAQAQIEAFDDTWTWSQETEQIYIELIQGDAPLRVQDALEAMRKLLGNNDVLAYLVMMTTRLVELYRVLVKQSIAYGMTSLRSMQWRKSDWGIQPRSRSHCLNAL